MLQLIFLIQGISVYGDTASEVISIKLIGYILQMIRIKLHEVCKQFNVTNAYQFQKLTGFSPGMAWRLWKGEWSNANIKTLNTLCNLLGCTPNDILDFTPDKE